jgi:hypothetical protein
VLAHCATSLKVGRRSWVKSVGYGLNIIIRSNLSQVHVHAKTATLCEHFLTSCIQSLELAVHDLSRHILYTSYF